VIFEILAHRHWHRVGLTAEAACDIFEVKHCAAVDAMLSLALVLS
jgi:hypothetical protein